MLEGILLKPNMVLSGKENPKQASVQEVAEATVRCLKRVVPAAVPGIVFLSGGQTDQQATEHLNAMNRIGDLPWQLSFSYGRALQAPVLKAWKGEHSKRQYGANGIPSPCVVQQQSAVRQIHRRDGNREGRIIFGAAIMRRCPLGMLVLVMLP